MEIKKYLVEAIGTLFLTLVIVTACNNGAAGNMAPFAIGAVLLGMIFAGAHISGAHYNPAVTVAFFMRGKIAMNDLIGYMIAQVVGAIIGALLAQTVLRGIETTHDAVPKILDIAPALMAEILGTFALTYVFLHSTLASTNIGNNFYGLAISLTVIACVYSLGPASGGVFNPAVAIACAVANMQDFKNIWIFFAGNFGGAALAAVLYQYLTEDRG
jgi:aquaporin Z